MNLRAMSKLKQKQYKELKRTLQKEWSTEMESEDSYKEGLSAPLHFKRYTIQKCKIVLQKLKESNRNQGSPMMDQKTPKKLT